MPIYEEHAVDQDLLVEGANNLRDYLQSQGYFTGHMAKTHYGPNGERQFQWYSPETAEALPAFLDATGTRLPVPDAQGLRPSGDRVRETLFNWLQPVLPGARVLDLFAGSGALGLVSMSRGACRTAALQHRAARRGCPGAGRARRCDFLARGPAARAIRRGVPGSALR